MKREEILTQYRLNPDAIVSYIEALEAQNKDKDARIEALEAQNKAKDARIEALESQIIELKERINELESLLNWTSQGKKKRQPNCAFSEKKPKTESSQKGSSRPLGGQKGHSGSTLNKVEDPDEIICHRLHKCKYCGHNIEESELIDYRTNLATILSQARSRRFLVLLNEAKRTAHCRAATRLAQLGTLNSGIF